MSELCFYGFMFCVTFPALAFFLYIYSSGMYPCSQEWLYIRDNGTAICILKSCKTLGCILSGPGDLLIFKFRSFFSTISGSNFNESRDSFLNCETLLVDNFLFTSYC